jgi:hypothetical protein
MAEHPEWSLKTRCSHGEIRAVSFQTSLGDSPERLGTRLEPSRPRLSAVTPREDLEAFLGCNRNCDARPPSYGNSHRSQGVPGWPRYVEQDDLH